MAAGGVRTVPSWPRGGSYDDLRRPPPPMAQWQCGGRAPRLSGPGPFPGIPKSNIP